MIKKSTGYIIDRERLICPECGGSGETLNENHYKADTSWEKRYVTCRRCFGIGTIRREINDESSL